MTGGFHWGGKKSNPTEKSHTQNANKQTKKERQTTQTTMGTLFLHGKHNVQSGFFKFLYSLSLYDAWKMGFWIVSLDQKFFLKPNITPFNRKKTRQTNHRFSEDSNMFFSWVTSAFLAYYHGSMWVERDPHRTPSTRPCCSEFHPSPCQILALTLPLSSQKYKALILLPEHRNANEGGCKEASKGR